MSLTTVYRNVRLLKSLDEVLELGCPDGGNRYDGNKPYPNAVCVKFNKIVDPDLRTLSDRTQEVAKETVFIIESHRLDFFGICHTCRHYGHIFKLFNVNYLRPRGFN